MKSMVQSQSPDLILLLNQAIAREIKVSIQYMFQHVIWIANDGSNPTPKTQSNFVGSHRQIWMPGESLKKIAITEMRHAEAIGERVVDLGGKPTTEVDPIVLGDSIHEILEIDRKEEQGAIELYQSIKSLAQANNDQETLKLFTHILGDEQKHFETFSKMLAMNW
jgi:bacterioferritin